MNRTVDGAVRTRSRLRHRGPGASPPLPCPQRELLLEDLGTTS